MFLKDLYRRTTRSATDLVEPLHTFKASAMTNTHGGKPRPAAARSCRPPGMAIEGGSEANENVFQTERSRVANRIAPGTPLTSGRTFTMASPRLRFALTIVINENIVVMAISRARQTGRIMPNAKPPVYTCFLRREP